MIISDGHRMLQIDRLDNRSISGRALERIIEQIRSDSAEVLVCSDFRHGIFSKQTIPELIDSIPADVFKVADSQVASRWGNILEFQNFDLITPNEREARFALGDQDSVVRPLALELYKRSGCRNLILKLGERGIITYRSSKADDYRAFFTIDSFADRVVDAVGTGDALLAYSTLALKATGSEVIASILGTMAAGIACETDGNEPVSPEAVLRKLGVIDKQIAYA
jgi:sugar/nucleoside kinase (ribokinase family)